MDTRTIKLNGVSFSLTYVLSFESEKHFIDDGVNNHYSSFSVEDKKKNLKSVYQIAKKMAKAQEKTEVLTNENPD
jgi:hypothetical protein